MRTLQLGNNPFIPKRYTSVSIVLVYLLYLLSVCMVSENNFTPSLLLLLHLLQILEFLKVNMNAYIAVG